MKLLKQFKAPVILFLCLHINLFSMEQAQNFDLSSPEKSPLIGFPEYIKKITHPGGADYEFYLQDNINFGLTLQHIESNILTKPLNQISLQDIQDINRLLTIDTNRYGECFIPGEIRKRGMIVGKHDLGSIDQWRSMYLTSQEIIEYDTILAQMLDDHATPEDALEKNAVPERYFELLRKIAFFPPLPNKIPDLMEKFLVQFKQNIENNMYPIQLAAFVHQQITWIHPFAAGNGRTARLVANIVLMYNGYKPIYCDDEKAYMKAVQAADQDLEQFCIYIENQLKLVNQIGKSQQRQVIKIEHKVKQKNKRCILF